MPVEIKELHIKVNVNQAPEGTTSSVASNSSSINAEDKRAFIAACVEEVLAILKQKAER